MNYPKLLEEKTYADLVGIYDNWYNRLEKIKAAHSVPRKISTTYSVADYSNEKAKRIGDALVKRLMAIVQIHEQIPISQRMHIHKN